MKPVYCESGHHVLTLADLPVGATIKSFDVTWMPEQQRLAAMWAEDKPFETLCCECGTPFAYQGETSHELKFNFGRKT